MKLVDPDGNVYEFVRINASDYVRDWEIFGNVSREFFGIYLVPEDLTEFILFSDIYREDNRFFALEEGPFAAPE